MVTDTINGLAGGDTGSDQDYSQLLTRPVPGVADHHYGPGRVFRVMQRGNWVPVLDWCPEVVERQDIIEGTDRAGAPIIARSDYLVRVGDVERVVTMDSMRDGSAWAAIPGAPVAPTSVVRDVLIGVVRDQAVFAPAVQMVERSGWHVASDGTRGYLYPDGAVWPPEAPLRLAVPPSASLAAYCQHPEAVADDVMAGTISDLIAHSGPSLVGLAAGLRALATSVEHPRTSVLLDGRRGGGKTLAEWEADGLTTGWGWPPHPVGSFSDTRNAIETLMGPVGDRAITIDDSPNGPNSGNHRDEQTGDYLEMVIRSAANDREVRNRQDRKDARKLRPSIKIHGLPIISVEHRPRSMRSSLMRRCVMIKYTPERGADTRWFKRNDHSVSLGPALRTMGDRVIAYIGSVDPAELGKWIRDRVLGWETALDKDMARRAPAVWDDSVLSIATGAAQVMVGIDLLGEAVPGLDLAELREATYSILIEACEHTAEAASDEYTTNDDLSVALSEVVNDALAKGKAFICKANGEAHPCLPGLAPTEQGLRASGALSAGGLWEPAAGASIPFYYVPDLHTVPALAVRSESLRTLARSDADNRLAGMSASTMPKRLAEAGAVLPDIAGGRGGTTQTRQIGPSGAPKRWVLIPASVVTGPADDSAGPHGASGPDGMQNPAGPDAPPAGTPEAPRADGGWGADTIGAEEWGADDSGPAGADVEQADPRPAGLFEMPAPVPGPRPAERATAAGSTPAAVVEPAPAPPAPASAPAPAKTPQRSRAPRSQTSAPAGGRDLGRVATVADGVLTLPNGTTTEAPAELSELVAAVAGGAGSETALILLKRGYGLPVNKPRQSAPWHKAFTPLVGAGWFAEGRPDAKPVVGRWTNLQHADYGVVRLGVGPWLGDGGEPFPYSLAESKDQADVAPAELSRRMAHLAELIGVTYRGTRANTAVTLFRERIADTAKRIPKWQSTQTEVGPQQCPLDWAWPGSEATAPEGTTVWSFDRNRAHLQATREVRLAMDDLKETGPIRYDAKLSGFFLINVPEWPWPDLPAPTSQVGTAWVTAPVLRQYARMAFEFKILKSWSAVGVQPQGSREFVKIANDAYAAVSDPETGLILPEHAAVGEAVKGLHQTLHGKLEATTTRVRRADWGLSFRDESWITGLRTVYRIAGVQYADDVPTGPVPLFVNMDEITYALVDAPTVEAACAKLPEITMGPNAGQYKVKTPVAAADWSPKGGAK